MDKPFDYQALDRAVRLDKRTYIEIAWLLGVSRAYLYMLRKGMYQPGEKIRQRIGELYPALKPRN